MQLEFVIWHNADKFGSEKEFAHETQRYPGNLVRWMCSRQTRILLRWKVSSRLRRGRQDHQILQSDGEQREAGHERRTRRRDRPRFHRTRNLRDQQGSQDIIATMSSAEDKISPDQHVAKALEIVQKLK
ncbi:MAG TPA: hypothetical protein VLM42_18270 [Bryobacteraceae bacterium]|nr:hypothetical protein [Bryobacteraceae bacterium]